MILIIDDGHTNSPFQPAIDENAMFDESSLMMSHASPQNDDYIDDDNNSRPGTIIGGNKKLKIVLSSLVQNSITNKNLSSNSNNVNGIEQNENSNLDSINKLVDSNSVDLQKDQGEDQASDEKMNQDDTELSFVVKPHLREFKFERNPVPVKGGIETSGLCSIM